MNETIESQIDEYIKSGKKDSVKCILGQVRGEKGEAYMISLADKLKVPRRWRPCPKHLQPKRNGSIGDADWGGKCSNCGQSPVVPGIGLCGPCCFGEADTVDGDW